MLKSEFNINEKHGVCYLSRDGRRVKFTPWLGNLFAATYDRIMERSVFPKKFNASLPLHMEILKKMYSLLHESDVLEVAAGSGNAAEVLPADNRYTGVDISSGLLIIAARRFREAGFENPALYVARAESLPFKNESFGAALCNVSLNFFDNVSAFAGELRRVLPPEGQFFCSVPVPERTFAGSRIRGHLNSTEELRQLFTGAGFEFQPLEYENGALLYFKTVVTKLL